MLTKDQGLPIRSYGVMMLVAVLSGTALAIQRARRMGLHPDMGISVAFWMFVPGIIGARMFYVIEYWQQYQRADLLSTVGAVLNVGRRGTGGLWLADRRPAGIGCVLAEVSLAAVGRGRSACPVFHAGSGAGANRMPAERLLLRGPVRSFLGSDLSCRQSCLRGPGDARPDVRLRVQDHRRPTRDQPRRSFDGGRPARDCRKAT